MSWNRSRLDQVTALIRDGSHGTHHDYIGGVPFLSAKDVRDGYLSIPTSCRRISLQDYGVIHKSYEIEANDILLTIVGTIGRCCLIPHGCAKFTVQRSVGIVRAKDISPDYLFQYFRSVAYQRNLEELTNASAQGGVYLGALAKTKIQFPESLPEQAKIAEVLSTVDRGINQTEALIAKQQRIKTGLMADLLTRGIDSDGNLRSEATHGFKDSPLGRIPVEWEVVSLDSVAQFITSGSRGWAQYYSVEGARFLRIGNLTRQHINMRLQDLVFVNPPASSEGKRTGVEPGDLLISITADLGIIGVIPEGFEESYVNQHISLVRLNQAEVDPRFVGWFLNSRQGQVQFERLNESGAKAGLNLPTIGKLYVAKMNVVEQAKISQMLDKCVTATSTFEAQLNKLRSLKTACMQDLLTGQVRVTNLL